MIGKAYLKTTLQFGLCVDNNDPIRLFAVTRQTCTTRLLSDYSGQLVVSKISDSAIRSGRIRGVDSRTLQAPKAQNNGSSARTVFIGAVCM